MTRPGCEAISKWRRRESNPQPAWKSALTIRVMNATSHNPNWNHRRADSPWLVVCPAEKMARGGLRNRPPWDHYFDNEHRGLSRPSGGGPPVLHASISIIAALAAEIKSEAIHA